MDVVERIATFLSFDPRDGRAEPRVLMESAERASQSGTVGVYDNTVEASLGALIESFEYALIKRSGRGHVCDARTLIRAPCRRCAERAIAPQQWGVRGRGPRLSRPMAPQSWNDSLPVTM